MSQILDSLPNGENDSILCCYVNATSKIQIARITNIPNWYFERVVFPGQRLVFETTSRAQLEIHTGMMASAILSDTIPCTRLSINQPTTTETSEPKASEPKASEPKASEPKVSEPKASEPKVSVTAKPKQEVSVKNKAKFDTISGQMKVAVQV